MLPDKHMKSSIYRKKTYFIGSRTFYYATKHIQYIVYNEKLVGYSKSNRLFQSAAERHILDMFYSKPCTLDKPTHPTRPLAVKHTYQVQ